jgi:hypothetical protein
MEISMRFWLPLIGTFKFKPIYAKRRHDRLLFRLGQLGLFRSAPAGGQSSAAPPRKSDGPA